jgi:hypothetical protein
VWKVSLLHILAFSKEGSSSEMRTDSLKGASEAEVLAAGEENAAGTSQRISGVVKFCVLKAHTNQGTAAR